VYIVLADITVGIHFLFILFVVLGGLLVIRRPKTAIIHLPAAIWGAAVELFGWICPLTPLENHFRNLAGGDLYSGDFVDKYLIPVIYPVNLTPSIQKTLGVMVILINVIFYVITIRKTRRNRTI